MTVGATARERRASRRARFSRLLAKTTQRLGMTDAQLARMVGTARQKVQLWRDAEDPQLPQASDIPAMGTTGVELLRCLAMEMGFTLTRRTQVESDGDMLRLVSDVSRESAEAVGAMLDGLATHDGRFTDEEIERADRELIEAEEALARARHAFDEMQRKRGAA